MAPITLYSLYKILEEVSIFYVRDENAKGDRYAKADRIQHIISTYPNFSQLHIEALAAEKDFTSLVASISLIMKDYYKYKSDELCKIQAEIQSKLDQSKSIVDTLQEVVTVDD